jgi:hypothetical protein
MIEARAYWNWLSLARSPERSDRLEAERGSAIGVFAVCEIEAGDLSRAVNLILQLLRFPEPLTEEHIRSLVHGLMWNAVDLYGEGPVLEALLDNEGSRVRELTSMWERVYGGMFDQADR